MTSKVFLDTNVIIDHLADRQPFANDSSMLFELHEQGQIKIYISALSVNIVYYISRKIIGEKHTLSMIDKLIEEVLAPLKMKLEKLSKQVLRILKTLLNIQLHWQTVK